jgi:hypothetical protein
MWYSTGALLKCWALPQLPHGIAVALLVTGVGGELSATRVLAVISFLPFECDSGTSMANGSLVHFASKLSLVATIRGFVQEYFFHVGAFGEYFDVSRYTAITMCSGVAKCGALLHNPN